MRPLFIDNFDKSMVAALPWTLTGGTPGTGTLALTSTAKEFSSAGQAMKYTSSTVVDEITQITRYMPPVNDHGVMVFGGRFNAADENALSISFNLAYRDGTNIKKQRLLHTFATDVWSYLGSDGAEHTLVTRDTSESTDSPRWHDFLIAANFKSGNQHIVMVDDQLIAKSAISDTVNSAADVTIPNLFDFYIEITNVHTTPSASVFEFDHLYGFALRSFSNAGEEGLDDILSSVLASIHGVGALY